VCVCTLGVHSSSGEREPASVVIRDASLLGVPGAAPQARHDFSARPSAKSDRKVSRQYNTAHMHTRTNHWTRWLGGLAVMALDSRLDGREFNSRPPQLVLGWVTVFQWANHLSISPTHSSQLSLLLYMGWESSTSPKCSDAGE